MAATKQTATRRKLTPPQLAAEWGCRVERIIALIHSGELRAINFAVNGNGLRRRYLIDRQDLLDFEARRVIRAGGAT